MSEFRFILNGQILNDHPDGWRDFTESIVRDEDLHGLTLVYENGLTFRGDGYAILEAQFLQSFCNETTLEIQQKCGGGQFEYVTDLLIKLTDLDTNLQKCSTEVKATDNGYYGMIHNNRQIPVPLDSQKTKNGENITPCPTIDIKFFATKLAVGGDVDYYAEMRMCYDQRDVINYVIQYISDNRITGYISDYLDTFEFNAAPNYGFNPEQTTEMSFAYLSGTELRRHAGDRCTVDFSGIINMLFTKHNLFWRIEGDKIRIEPFNYFLDVGENPVLVLENQPDITRSMDTAKLYSRVEVGSEKATPDQELIWGMPLVELIAHAKQTYALTGVCNTDTALDLVCRYVIDSNTIEKVIVDEINAATPSDRNQEYDQDVFYVQYFRDTSDGIYYACFSTIFQRPELSGEDTGITYNPYLTNDNVIGRHSVQGGGVIDQVDNDDNFLAGFTAGDLEVWIQDFQDATDYIPTSSLPSQVASILNNTFQHGGKWPIQYPWDKKLFGYNAANSNINNENAVNGANNVLFNDDSTPPFFDPNDNWKNATADEMYFDAPQTGVYGFELDLLINKQIDRVLLNGGPPFNYVSTAQANSINAGGNGIQNFLVTFPVRLLVKVYLSVFDTNDEVIQSYPCYFLNDTGDEAFGEWWYLAPFRQSIGQFIEQTSGETSYPGSEQTYATRSIQHTQITDNWNFWSRQSQPNAPLSVNALAKREKLLYLQQGQRVRVRIEIDTVSHTKPFEGNNQRWVRYGIMKGSTMGTFYAFSGGGNFDPVDPDLYYALNYALSRPLTKKQWDEVKAGIIKPIDIATKNFNYIRTFGSKITRTLATGATKFELIGNRNQPNF